MRIAVVAPLVTEIREPQLGGSQALLADLAAGLVRRGHDVEVFAARGSSIEGVRVVDTGVDPEALRGSLYRASGDARGADGAVGEAFDAAFALVARGSFDVVHNHAFDAPAFDAADRIDAPVVHTLHLPPDDEVAAALARSPRARVVCVSQQQGRAWSEHVRVDAVIRDGVPVATIPWSAAADGPALFAGRFSPEKGAAEAIEIARAARVPIDVVGSPYDDRYAAERIEPHRGAPGVKIVDALPRRALWERMAQARAVLCPVSWEEPFGLVAAEAQAAGTPVIAFARGALREVVADGRTGALVEDVAAGARALRDVGRFDRRACRAHAVSTLDLETTLDGYIELYREVAELSRAG